VLQVKVRINRATLEDHEKELQRHFWKERPTGVMDTFVALLATPSQETIRQYRESQG